MKRLTISPVKFSNFWRLLLKFAIFRLGFRDFIKDTYMVNRLWSVRCYRVPNRSRGIQSTKLFSYSIQEVSLITSDFLLSTARDLIRFKHGGL